MHADNCNLQDNGDCLQESPAFTWRDYSAIMYLNSDFEGGQFVMTDHTGRRVMVRNILFTPIISYFLKKEVV